MSTERLSKLIDIVIVNHNSGKSLQDCIEAISAVEISTNTIVIDNASNDNSLDFISITKSRSISISLIRNSINTGFSSACNQGALESESPYILFLNPDCILQHDAITMLLNCIDHDNQIGMVGGLLLNPDGTEQAGGRRTAFTPWRSFVKAFNLSFLRERNPVFSDFDLHNKPLPLGPVEVDTISGACMLVRREAFEQVEGFDENYFLHCEDVDICMSFREAGWKIMFVPEAKITHYIGSCSSNRPYFVEWNKHNGMIYFYKKHFKDLYPRALMWVVVFGVWLRYGLKSLTILFRKT